MGFDETDMPDFDPDMPDDFDETDNDSDPDAIVESTVATEVTKPPPPPIDIMIKEEDGMVDAQLMLTLKPSEELVEEIAAKRLRNPHYVVFVSSIREEDRYGNGVSEYHQQTSAYIKRFDRPFPFIKFKRPGRNRIWATVVDINSKAKEKWADKVQANGISLINSHGAVLEGSDSPWGWDYHYGLGTREVVVPEGVFSTPAALKVAWVRQFWRNTGIDDCDLRKRLWFGAMPATLFVQLYGLIVRPLLFALALIMAKREIRPRQFVAFWPHQGWNTSGESWWFTDKNGKERKCLWILSPPVLLVVGALFFGLPAVWCALWGGSYWGHVFQGFLWAACLAAIATIILVIWVGVVKWRKQNRPSHEETEEERLARLKSQMFNTSEALNWEDLPEHQKTLYLRFANVKSKVCRPIAQ